MGHLEFFHTAVFAAVLLSWLALGSAFLLRKRHADATPVRRGRSYLPGLFLQFVAFALVWGDRRQLFTHLVELPFALEVAVALLTVLLAIASVLLAIRAIKVLGRHWSIDAQAIEGHTLVTEGPYGIVRHPIYAGLFGLLVATGLSLSQWEGLLSAAVLYGAGTALRIAGEEKLLQETFGEAYREYASRVPALLPFTR